MAEEKKERFEILLEEIKGKVQLVLEGHDTIRSEMKQMENRIREDVRVDNLKLEGKFDRLGKVLDATAAASYGLLTDVQKDVKEVKATLDKHVRLPVHA
jgi:hypothetical protein